MRPINYTSFDPGKDFMHVEDLEEEKRITNLLSESDRTPLSSLELLTKRLDCRPLKTVPKKDFDENMTQFSEKLADRIFYNIKEIDTEIGLQLYKSILYERALRSHKTNRHPEFLETEFSEFLPGTNEADLDKRDKFLRNRNVIFYILVQKFIRVRESEFSGQQSSR